jgi:hypothetical protein
MEPLGVQRDVFCPDRRDILGGIDRFHRTFPETGSTANTPLGINIEHTIRAWLRVDAIDRTHIDTDRMLQLFSGNPRLCTHIETRFSNDIGAFHNSSPLQCHACSAPAEPSQAAVALLFVSLSVFLGGGTMLQAPQIALGQLHYGDEEGGRRNKALS